MLKLFCAVRAAKVWFVIIVEVVHDGPFFHRWRTVLLNLVIGYLFNGFLFTRFLFHLHLLWRMLVLMKLALIGKQTVIGNLISFHQSVMLIILGKTIRLVYARENRLIQAAGQYKHRPRFGISLCAKVL